MSKVTIVLHGKVPQEEIQAIIAEPFTIYDESVELQLTKHESESALSIQIYGGHDVSVTQLDQLVGQTIPDIGYFVNILEDLDPKAARANSSYALARFARTKNLFTREQAKQLTKDIIRNDLLSILHLLLSKHHKSRAFVTKRFLDSSVNLDEISLAFGEARCLKKSNENISHQFENFPVSLTPAIMPKSLYDKIRLKNIVQNEIWMKMTYDPDWMLETCSDLEKDDDFVAHFTEIIRKVKDCKTAQKLKLSITRNDYLFQGDQPLQVEFNMIASSLGPISQRHGKALVRIADLFNDQRPRVEEADNEAFLAEGIKIAHDAYGKKDAIVVMVVGREKNVFDQFAPWQKLLDSGIHLIRYSFADLSALLKVDPTTGVATVLGKEVALFYFRDGYMPHQYVDDAWKVRETIELSKAIKCPDVTQQLVNMKYFQWVLNQESTWIRFGYDKKLFEDLKTTFCSIFRYTDFKADKKVMLDHIASNGGLGEWVLKPQREGGANNYFGEHIKEQVDTLNNEQLHAFILMKKIDAKCHLGIQCGWNGLQIREIIDEVGFYTYTLTDNDKICHTGQGGSLVRSKVVGVDEGGVGMGFSVINSLNLTDE